MGPTRSGASVPQKKTKNSIPSGSFLPGVQKIKSSLRQTKRLLAKDTLAADVRIATERRLKSLESDLANAERTRKERHLAIKYHKVKFFERQKVCRKIKHANKALNNPDTSPDMLASLPETIFAHRVDLNYILHYPKAKKYISLFPPDEPKATDQAGDAETDRLREELRRWVKEAMEKGEMDAEPEVTLEKGRPRAETIDGAETLEPWGHTREKGKEKEMKTNKLKGVPGDAFFETPDDDERDDDG